MAIMVTITLAQPQMSPALVRTLNVNFSVPLNLTVLRKSSNCSSCLRLDLQSHCCHRCWVHDGIRMHTIIWPDNVSCLALFGPG